MSLLKNKEEINKIREGGKILAEVLRQTASLAKEGVSTWDLDQFAEKEIIKAGGTPAFKNYGDRKNPFPATLCTSINSEIVHGIPSKERILQHGDIISLDIGMKYKGMYTDTALSVGIGAISKEVQKLLNITRDSLYVGIKEAQAGNTTGDIGYATQKFVEASGFNVVRDLVGHGVGYELHEDPQVPSYGRPGKGDILKPGLVIAIEPMVTLGDYNIFIEDDGWTITTADGSLAAHFEHTILITDNGPEIITK